LSFLRHEKIYQSDGLKRELNCSFNSLTDHRSDESSTGYSFMSCSPAELMSASPVLQSFSLNLAAVKPPAANRNCPYFSLSQSRGPLQCVTGLCVTGLWSPEICGRRFVVRRAWNFAKSGKPHVIIQKLYRSEAPAKRPAQISPERAGSRSGSD